MHFALSDPAKKKSFITGTVGGQVQASGQDQDGRVAQASAYYHWLPVWVGEAAVLSGKPDEKLRSLGDEVFRRELVGGLRVRVLRDGMFIFDFSGWMPGRILSDIGRTPSDWETAEATILCRVALMNAHLSCLYTAVGRMQDWHLDKMALTVPRIFQMQSFEDDHGLCRDPALVALTLGRHPVYYTSGLPLDFDWRLAHRAMTVEQTTLEESFVLLDSILRKENASSVLILVELLTRACKAYEDHDFNSALITSWTVTENLLRTKWERYIVNTRARQFAGEEFESVDPRCRASPSKLRAYKVSEIADFLSSKGELPPVLYEDVSASRKVRNDWMHKLGTVGREDAEKAVDAAQRLLDLVEDLELRVPLRVTLHGL
ncbi:MAG: hypothetical protein WKH64_06260 [Chloroflexia bacterium]